MKRFFAIICALVICLCCFGISCDDTGSNGFSGVSDELTIVKNGESDYKIVVPKAGTVCEDFAAKELQTFIEQSTGAKLSIVSDDSVRFSKYSSFISVGETSLLEDAKIDVKNSDLKLDGFIVKTIGKQVFICGARDRGTLYGSYDFLEKFLGVRFFTPEITRVPETENLKIPQTDVKEVPAINVRDYYIPESDRDALYIARQRMVALYGANYDEYGGTMYRDMHVSAHNMLDLCNYNLYKDDHEDWFYNNGSVIDICLSKGLTADGQPDPSYEISPWSVCLETLKKQIKDNPEISYFSVCQMDIPFGCTCSLCEERSATNRGGRSGVLLRFVNALSNELDKWLEEEYPEGRQIKLVTFAYSYTSNPPVDDQGNWYVEPNDNVVIWLATSLNYAYSLDDARQEKAFTEKISAWRVKAKSFFYWDYRVNFREYWWYMPGLTTLQNDIRYLAEINTEYVFLEAASGSTLDPCTWQNQLKAYLAGKLMWNPDADVVTIINDYLDGVYGDSAPVVKEMLNLFEDNYERLRQDETVRNEFGIDHEYGYGTVSSKWYPLNMLERSINILESEIERVQSSALTSDEKTQRVTLLKNVLCTPQKMLLRNYKSYYMNDNEGEAILARKFLSNIDAVGMAGFDIGGYLNTYDSFKENYGL